MKKQPQSVHVDERAKRTVGEMVRAVRLANAKQQNLFFRSKKEKFEWEHKQMR